MTANSTLQTPTAAPKAVVTIVSLKKDDTDADRASAGRERLDQLDRQITRLIEERIELSLRVQAARMAEGGRSIDIGRENAVIKHYSSALGRPGTVLAMALVTHGG